MLALVWACKFFRPYLLGQKFTVRTDHHALQWLTKFKEPKGQVARWLESLAEFEIHRPGKAHVNADVLSRRPCNQCGLVEQEHLVSTVSESTSSWIPKWSQTELQEAQCKDPDIKKVITWLVHKTLPTQFPKHGSPNLQALWCQRKHLIVKNGILYRQWIDVPNAGETPLLQLVLPIDLVSIVLKQLHDHVASGGHLGPIIRLRSRH